MSRLRNSLSVLRPTGRRHEIAKTANHPSLGLRPVVLGNAASKLLPQCDGVRFNGAGGDTDTPYFTTGVDLAQSFDSPYGVISVWLRPFTFSAAAGRVLVGRTTVGGDAFGVMYSITEGFNSTQAATELTLRDAAQNQLMFCRTPTFPIIPVPNGFYNHFAACWDTSRGWARLFHNGVNVSNATISGAVLTGNVDYTVADWTVGRGTFGGSIMTQDMADLYFAPGQLLDLTIPDNMRRLRTPTGRPADLGASGERVTGKRPAVYMHLDDGETLNNFQANRGYGGAFSLVTGTGTYSVAPSSPND